MFLTKLLKLGYHHAEANWINNLSKLILTSHPDKMKLLHTISVHDDGHTFHTDMYTKAIVSSMLCNKDWSETHVHLNYDVVWDKFYRHGFYNLGNRLLTTPHEIELLKKFNKDKNLVSLVKSLGKLPNC